MQSRMKRRGFTLIELLIVVAIIAILALIAVPNFLEAQTRAKVSRVKADMRSLATAQEAYMVDWNSYTFANIELSQPEFYGYPWTGYRQLTTPVPYITSIPLDAFGYARWVSGWGGYSCYGLGTGVAGVGASGELGGGWSSGGTIAPGPYNTYMLTSNGPDRWSDTINQWKTSQYPWPNLPDTDRQVERILGLVYDPTNGTVSRGDIFRCGGTKPPGRPLHAFWEAVEEQAR